MLSNVRGGINKMQNQVADTGRTFGRVNENLQKVGLKLYK